MDERIDELLGRLDEAITQKCRELKRKRQYRLFRCLFAAVCLLFLILPACLTLWGTGGILFALLFASLLSCVFYFFGFSDFYRVARWPRIKKETK